MLTPPHRLIGSFFSRTPTSEELGACPESLGSGSQRWNSIPASWRKASVLPLELIVRGWRSPHRGWHVGATPQSRNTASQGARGGQAGPTEQEHPKSRCQGRTSWKEGMVLGPALEWASLGREEGPGPLTLPVKLCGAGLLCAESLRTTFLKLLPGRQLPSVAFEKP